MHAYTCTLVHSYTHTLIHSCTHTLIHSYTPTLKHMNVLPRPPPHEGEAFRKVVESEDGSEEAGGPGEADEGTDGTRRVHSAAAGEKQVSGLHHWRIGSRCSQCR
jgi:hypothetical protein